MQSGYQPKTLYFDDDARTRLVSGIKKISTAVKSTLGPSGNTVLIESPQHTHGITVTKDGVTVAKSIELFDPVENLAVQMMKEAAEKTATSVGDGTTTSIVLTESMVTTGTDVIGPSLNRTEVLRAMVDISHDVVEELRKSSRKVTKQMLLDVATVSANNDKAIGKIIADVYAKVGKSGIVTVEKSQTHTTYSDVTLGLKIDRGYYSQLFVNDHDRDECVFDDVKILVTDTEIGNILQIENVLKPIVQRGEKLLIIAPCGTNMVNTLAANVVKNGLKLCAIQPPNFGYKRHELMADIALSVGATYFSEATGDNLSIITYDDLGSAARVTVGESSSVVITKTDREWQGEIDEKTVQLNSAYQKSTKKADREFLKQRIASLSGGIGVIYAGGNTDLEQKELYDRIDDAVCAVRAALDGGVLPGSGEALFSCPLKVVDGVSNERDVAAFIIRKAMDEPVKQILMNAGLDYQDYYSRQHLHESKRGYGLNLKTMQVGDLIAMGVTDPFKVTSSALLNAVSVAVTILSTNAIVTMTRTYEAQ